MDEDRLQLTRIVIYARGVAVTYHPEEGCYTEALILPEEAIRIYNAKDGEHGEQMD